MHHCTLRSRLQKLLIIGNNLLDPYNLFSLDCFCEAFYCMLLLLLLTLNTLLFIQRLLPTSLLLRNYNAHRGGTDQRTNTSVKGKKERWWRQY